MYCYSSYLSRIYNASFKHFYIFIIPSIITMICFFIFDVLNNNRSLDACISTNLPNRSFKSTCNYVNTNLLIFINFHFTKS